MKNEYYEREFNFRDAIVGFRRIITYVSEDRFEFTFLCILAFIGAFLDPIATYFFSRILFGLSNPYLLFGRVSAPLGFLFLWALTTFLSLLVERISHMRGGLLDEKARATFYSRVYSHVLRLPLSFHKNTNSGALWGTVNNAGVAIADLFSKTIIPIFPQIISVLVMLTISIYVNWVFGVIFLVGVFAYVLLIIHSAIPGALIQRKLQATYSFARTQSIDALVNVRAVKDFTTEELENSKFIDLFCTKAYGMYVQYILNSVRYGYLQRLIVFLTRLGTLFLSLYLIMNNRMNIADLILLNAYVGSIFNPLSQLSQRWINTQKNLIIIDEAEELIKETEEEYNPANSKNVRHVIDGEVKFEHVSFFYEPERKILDDINFEAKKGQVVALVGESGVGKSTMVDIISAYYFASEGKVYIDGEDIRNIPLKELRSQIATVPQETVLFNDTIKNNLLYGNLKATDSEITEVAHKAHCYDFILKLPLVWETIVGERGLKLSVGQKQRISIARAMLRNPKILILDEPTSALDAGTETIITESLKELMKNRTTFIIAHRLSTVRRADLILVFKGGKIIERGTHEELMTRGDGEYKRLYDLQIGLVAD